jgi:hypothetical protein
VPIAKEIDLSLTAVAAVFTIALWLRLVGATAAGHHRGGWQSATFGQRRRYSRSICSALARSSSEALAIARL